MAKQFYATITEADRHAIATLFAAGVRRHAVIRATGLTEHAICHIEKSDGWAELLAGKRSAIEALKAGDL